jgi:hypothetical protein
MGVDYYAYGFLGVRLQPSQVTVDVEVRNCKCEPEPRTTYCPSCGRKATRYERRRVDGKGYDSDTDFYGCELVRGTDGGSVYACLSYVKTDMGEDVMAPHADVAWVRDRLRQLLGPIGLWTPEVERSFGFWIVPFVSY